jgi:hypothetical protein
MIKIIDIPYDPGVFWKNQNFSGLSEAFTWFTTGSRSR